MSLSGTKCTRILLIFVCVIFSWISGSLLVVYGGTALADISYIKLHTILTCDRVPQYIFILGALCLVALGGFIITLGLFGCFGSLCDNNCMIKTYIYLLVFVFVAEIGLAVCSLYLYFTFPESASGIREALIDKLKTNYGYRLEYTFSEALDYTQMTLNCCGIDSYDDYNESNWQSMAQNHGSAVPISCCIQREIIFPNEANGTVLETNDLESPSITTKCQSPNLLDSGGFLNSNVRFIIFVAVAAIVVFHTLQGCWSEVEKQYFHLLLWSSIFFASLALLQMLGAIFPICWLRRTDHKTRKTRIRTRQAEPLL